MSTSITAGGLVVLDPSDKRVILFDWDTDALASGAEISTSTWTITAIKQQGATALTNDSSSIVASSRKAQTRLDATTATAGDSYFVANKIVTNESPAQTIERRIKVLIQDE